MFLINIANALGDKFTWLLYFFAFPLLASPVIIFVNYLFLVLESSLDQIEQAPVISSEQASFSNPQTYRVLILIGIVLVPAFMLQKHLSNFPAITWLVITAFLIPAVLINTVRFHELTKSIAIGKVMDVIKSLGISYFFLLLIFYLNLALIYWGLKNPSISFLFIFMCAYLLVMSFYWMGQLILEYSIPLEVNDEDTQKEKARRRISDSNDQAANDEKRLVDIGEKVYALCRAREFRHAYLFLEDELSKDNWQYDQYFFEKLKSTYYADFAMAHSRAYASRLIANNKVAKAWTVCEYNLKERERFFLKKPEDVISLSELSLSIEQQKLFNQLVLTFIKEFQEEAEKFEIERYLKR